MVFSSDTALAELGFHHPKYVSKAENSWKVIASALQQVLGHNVEIRIHLTETTSPKDKSKWKKPSFNLFSCSRRICYRSTSSPSHISDPNSGKPSTRDNNNNHRLESCSSESGSHSQVSHTCCNTGKEVIRAIRNKDGNALRVGMTKTPSHHHLLQEEKQPGCFPRTTVKLRKSNASEMILLEKNEHNSLELSVPCTEESSEIYFHASDPVIVSCSRSDIISFFKAFTF